MKAFIIVATLVLGATCAPQTKFVWDLLKPALTSEDIQMLMANRATQWPTYSSIPETKFDCATKKQSGFYADIEAQCQVFHRCDLSGFVTSYLCTNSSVFNQITLTCDYWFNVECEKSLEFENFSNSRLYSDKPLFDSPPADYVIQNSGAVAVSQPKPVAAAKPRV